MRSKDIQDSLQEGFELAPMPPVGPDGALRLPRMRTPAPPPPRLCEQGPCVHYHQFTVQLDAEGARAAAVAGPGEHHGKLVGRGAEAFHTETHHYCYPSLGIEANLGSLPVTKCNHWRPKSNTQLVAEARDGDTFLMSQDGQRYTAEVQAWNDARAAELAAQAADEAEAARVLAEMDALTPTPNTEMEPKQ